MRASLKIFLALAILLSLSVENSIVEAAEFQELRSKVILPVLPKGIRQGASKRVSRPILYPKEFPRRAEPQPSQIYTQRQPKRPPPVYVPRRPTAFAGQRGPRVPKNFGPPRAKFK